MAEGIPGAPTAPAVALDLIRIIGEQTLRRDCPARVALPPAKGVRILFEGHKARPSHSLLRREEIRINATASFFLRFTR